MHGFCTFVALTLDHNKTVYCINYLNHKNDYVNRVVDFKTLDQDIIKEKNWEKENAPIKSDDVSEKIDSFLLAINKNHKSYPLTKKYRKQIDTVFMFLHGEFFYWKEDIVPFRFDSFGEKNEKKAFVVAPIFTNQCYNSFKLSAKERASKSVIDELLPKLRAFKYFKSAEIKYIGLSCVYSCKDFTDDKAGNKIEFVGIVIPVNLLKKYVSGNITKEDFVNQIDIYSKDKDSIDLVKIKINIQ